MQQQSAQSDTTSRLVATEISKQFGGVSALAEVHFECGSTEIVGLIGPNGAGKTTLLNVVSALERPDHGKVTIGDRTLTGLSPHDIARNGVARTFQSVRLFSRLTVRQHVEVGVAVARRAHRTRVLDADLVLRTLGLFEVAGHRARQLPYALQRRVEIARAVALCPDYLLLDEPAAGTSEVESIDLAETIRRVRESGGMRRRHRRARPRLRVRPLGPPVRARQRPHPRRRRPRCRAARSQGDRRVHRFTPDPLNSPNHTT